MRMRGLGCIVLGAGASAALLCVRARQGGETAIRSPGVSPGGAHNRVLRVPHAAGSVVLDGDTDDPAWTALPGPARTGPFLLANGEAARPYSDARLVWGDGHLYLALYGADNDIHSGIDDADGPLWLDDSFRLIFTRGDVQYAIDVSPNGVVTDASRRLNGAFDYAWNSGAHVSHERDGTPNDPTDDDEEWVIEMAVPFDAFGMRGERGERVGFVARRCDTPKNERRVCASWGEGESGAELVLD